MEQNIPTLSSLDDFDNAAFFVEDIGFSSFAYRIDATRILCVILKAQYSKLLDKIWVDEADIMLANWLLLPGLKRDIVGRDGEVDEMLFQAHMIARM